MGAFEVRAHHAGCFAPSSVADDTHDGRDGWSCPCCTAGDRCGSFVCNSEYDFLSDIIFNSCGTRAREPPSPTGRP
eukprot:7293442-Alexandrium_andersonii.AAC.1